MKKAKTSGSKETATRIRPALTPEARENQMINAAVDLAEQQLRDGTASSAVIVHYLKLGSSKDRLERERLEEENKLLRAKTEAIQSAKNVEELYKQAITSMGIYRGEIPDDDYKDGDEY